MQHKLDVAILGIVTVFTALFILSVMLGFGDAIASAIDGVTSLFD